MVDNDTLPHTQHEPASGSRAHTMVRRAPGLLWERASASEEAELATHEAEERCEQALQETRDAEAWDRLQEHKAAEAKAKSRQSRAVKKFTLEVVVADRHGNELATATLEGDTEHDDSPRVTFGLSTQMVVNAEVDADACNADVTVGDNAGDEEVHNAQEESDAETETVGMVAPPVTLELETLEDILSSAVCREWFQWWSENQIDNDMVEAKFGKLVLETFEINRAMIEMAEASQVDKVFLPARGGAVPVEPAATTGGGDSSSSGADSHAGCSDADLAASRALAARSMEEDGEGVGRSGLQGDGAVRQWHLPKLEREEAGHAEVAEPSAKLRRVGVTTDGGCEAGGVGAVETAAAGEDVGSAGLPTQEVLGDTQMDAVPAADAVIEGDDETGMRPSMSTTEGAAAGSSSTERGRRGQMDLSH